MAKARKFNLFITILLCLIFCVIGFVVGAGGYFYYITEKQKSEIKVYTSGELVFHFLELGNQNTGDCTYINAGGVDILIDAGSKVGSIPTITSYINNYVKDDILEYVIVTHAHEDHYAGFAADEDKDSIFDMYTIGTVIDFAQATSNTKENKIYGNYQRELSEVISRGTKHYTAKECVDKTNGATDVYKITADITMTILNQEYYHSVSSTENNHSVCTLFTQDDRNFLFTGDLEHDGEESLVSLNNLPHCELYKAGHHGSGTSSYDKLLNAITPDICCICCCAGNVEYLKTTPQNLSHSFPYQEFIDRISKHTYKVYVTTLGKIKWDEEKNKWVNDGFTSMNGNIVVTSKTNGVYVNCSNNNNFLKDTDWFKNNRVCPPEWENVS